MASGLFRGRRMPSYTDIPRWSEAAAIFLLGIVLFSCDSATGPNNERKSIGDPHINMTLTLSSSSGSTGSPLHAKAVVENVGLGRATYIEGCGCEQPFLELLDERGNILRLQDACAVLPACPCGFTDLNYKETLQANLSVEGHVWGERCGEELGLAPGTYSIVAVFSYEYGGELTTIKKTASFDWTQ
jgi:hypothetical protein